MQPAIIASLLASPLLVLAQFPQPVQYSNILKSPINENITIAYKTPPAGTCTTAFSTQKQFTGYIGMIHHTNPLTLAHSIRPSSFHAATDTTELLDQHLLLVHRGTAKSRDGSADNLDQWRTWKQ